MSPDSSESTLPTLSDVVATSASTPELRCTIVFHPRIERIGQSAVLDCAAGECVLGRHSPLFSAGDDAGAAPLDNGYISRRALQVRSAGDGVRLIRPQQASRCRAAGREVQGEVVLDNAALEAGVPLLLSHSVVLMLRRTVAAPVDETAAGAGLLGSSPVMRQLRAQIQRAAQSDLDVLVRGETGAGKELVAQAIHAGSGRAGRPLVSVNMAAIPASLAAADLFGNTRGAFTGADRARPGYFQQAEGGTLFLDEVGDTPEEVQPLLLRALQQREIQVVGGATRKIDVRVISATDAPLDGEDCSFKSALRYRLGTLEIDVPALREHLEDMGQLLLDALLRMAAREGRQHWIEASMREERGLARWARLFYDFCCYDWPGNVRQLENFAAQVVLASASDPVIPETLLAQVRAASREGEADALPTHPERRWRPLSEVSEAEFEVAMRDARYEVAAVADALGVSRQSLYRRIGNSEKFRSASDVPLGELRSTLDACGNDVRQAAMSLQVSESGLRQRLRAIRASA
ncbi:sigma-54-dependent Fis family transcriptional regulator [Seongchinamella unica]|uniref:Sigma-54-dependent Fis family transcriptional regulator n=1 Tax=Seongchinamella unica TaxID=2547392 RepID=A0A4V2ZXN8_9GAMM|nr:sigma 54-interacting transcriptional regulator [Seongchinamella unica]TDG15055.1 sigma-54-dependent Fis family transcriptional regulator [Seongchinamella unica]